MPGSEITAAATSPCGGGDDGYDIDPLLQWRQRGNSSGGCGNGGGSGGSFTPSKFAGVAGGPISAAANATTSAGAASYGGEEEEEDDDATAFLLARFGSTFAEQLDSSSGGVGIGFSPSRRSQQLRQQQRVTASPASGSPSPLQSLQSPSLSSPQPADSAGGVSVIASLGSRLSSPASSSSRMPLRSAMGSARGRSEAAAAPPIFVGVAGCPSDAEEIFEERGGDADGGGGGISSSTGGGGGGLSVTAVLLLPPSPGDEDAFADRIAAVAGGGSEGAGILSPMLELAPAS